MTLPPPPRPLLVTALFLCWVTLTITATTLIAPRSSATDDRTTQQPEPRQRRWHWPLDPAPTIVGRFDPPAERWSAGHRGIDLDGRVGQAVVAVDDGTVTFAGVLAGRGVVVVAHGALRSTYEPVTPAVARGDRVGAGQAIGLLQGVQSHCLPAACLHLGARVGSSYIDPEDLLGDRSIRLKPLAGLPEEVWPVAMTSAGRWGAAVGGDAPITSDFGPRLHPLTGRTSFHDGIDYGVGCGTPITAAAAGVVIRAGVDLVYGHQIVVGHGSGLETRYGHMYADGVLVRPGERVRAGQVIGIVGSDGWSTGCHLHFTVVSHGTPVDPLEFVPS